jgi:hypothetical protein
METFVGIAVIVTSVTHVIRLVMECVSRQRKEN